MKPNSLVRRSLFHYWRTNLAVIAGVATAVAVLAGALLVGQSVRSSLRNLVLERLGNTQSVITSTSFFREELAGAFAESAPMISLVGVVRHQATGRVATGVSIYAVDERFWQFHGVAREGPPGREILLNESVARELDAEEGEGILLRLEEQSYIPAESLHGRKEEGGKTIRLTNAGVLPAAEMGDFSLQLSQGAVKAVFVPLQRIQTELLHDGFINTILLGARAESPERTLADSATLEDLGLKTRAFPDRGFLQIESRSGLFSGSLAAAIEAPIRSAGFEPVGFLTYLANTIRRGDREIPYSLVAATAELDEDTGSPSIDQNQRPASDSGVRAGDELAAATAQADEDAGGRSIVLNQWAASDLGARIGDEIELEFFLWGADNRLDSGAATFRLAGVRPLVRDPDLAPDYPGITDSEDVTDWDPPFPLDLNRIRKKDEDYWDDYRTTPKAFLPLATGQELWRSRWGQVSAYRIPLPAGAAAGPALASLRKSWTEALNPLEHGFSVIAVRELGLAASRGATDFGEYFVYFSFFLVVSALLLAGLFFRLGVEQRVRETGLLEAVGLSPGAVLSLFSREGLILALAGAALGVAGAVAYCELILYGLRTWWIDAVGTAEIRLDADPVWLAAGAGGGVIAAYLALFLTLRALRKISPRSRLAGVTAPPDNDLRPSRRGLRIGLLCGVMATGLLGAAAAGAIPQVAGFFGAGTLLLIAALFFLSAWLKKTDRAMVRGAGPAAILRLGFRNATHRPGRTVLSVSLIASAIFLIVSVDSFRLTESADLSDPKSASGGYPLMAESALPVYRNPATAEGLANLGLDDLAPGDIVPFRLRPGDDVSCLNLYRPENPRVLGATQSFLESNRFRFQKTLAETDAERQNPWSLLARPPADGVIPAAVAANSMTYILHRKLGDIIELPVTGRTVRLRLVAALADNVFQRELIISEDNFRAAFPDLGGYRVFLIQASPEDAEPLTERLEDYLSDFGLDVVSTRDTLAGFHRIENTYLSTFQSLGGLGLVLGTLGLAVVLLRNVLERRKELALLRAVGYSSGDLALIVIAENLLVVAAGIGIGALTALVAIVPALASRGGSLSPVSLLMLLGGVLLVGLLSSVLATAAAIRSPLLAALRSE